MTPDNAKVEAVAPPCKESPMTSHRIRRGKLVEIPEQWRGKTVHEQTKRKRKSKARHKNKRGGKTP